ncbi:MAG: DNA adenine methylase [Succinivibrionaceae bacterium]
MDNIKITPFVKWAGGKKQLVDRLKAYVPSSYNRYYEPFIGGGALFFDILPKHAVINDINGQLINVYRQLKNNAEIVISILKEFDSVACDKEYYLKIRAIYNQKIVSDILDEECAALMIWINKHCFNGLYRVNSKGLFNVPYNNKVTGSSMVEENLRTLGNFLQNNDIVILRGDFEVACKDVQPNDFVYFDSPYVPVSTTANFTDYTKDGFKYEDHLRLVALFKNLDKLGVKVMLSNNNVDLVHELYKGYKIEEVNVKRAINSNASKRVGKEVIITNY